MRGVKTDAGRDRKLKFSFPWPNTLRESRRCHDKQFTRIHSEINAHKYAFLPRTIVDWNNLPPNVVAAESLESFKKRLYARSY